ncbi:MAG: hypothetical protein M0R46_14270 [Candidatus Muirbacterium halophilum]|nr:hypothetical protein [Candidatus Muirbacterium halophilum]MCK9477087.1 hypothetical protein [Candidatus Muirbacterium halophilum]
MTKLIVLFYILFNCFNVFSYNILNESEFILDFSHNNEEVLLKHYISYEDYLKNSDYFNFELGIDIKKGDSEVFVKRFFVEQYKQNYKLGFGRQRIIWGNSLYFNKTDIFNSNDITDLKKDKNGVDSVFVSYSNSFYSRTEFAYKFDSNNDDIYAFRYTWINQSFEYMINFLEYYNVNLNENKKEFVLEFKGDKGIGIWGQIGFQLDSKIDNNLVIGTDYSWEINQNNLVFSYECNVEKNNHSDFYGLSYTINEFTAVNFNILTNSNLGKVFNGLVYNFIIDDFKSMDVSYNKYFDKTMFLSNNSWDFKIVFKKSV